MKIIITVVLCISVFQLGSSQYAQDWTYATAPTTAPATYATNTDNWNWDMNETPEMSMNDYETLAFISPVQYGAYGVDFEDYETYGGKTTTALPVTYTSSSSKKQPVALNPVFETLPETFASPIYAAEVVNTQLIDQPIKAPRVIRQPIIKQRLVEQPIYRTRIVNQPIIRRVVSQPVVRPMITKTTTTKPYTIEQQVVQPKIYEQNVIRQTYSEKHDARQPIVEAATHVQQNLQQPIYSSKNY